MLSDLVRIELNLRPRFRVKDSSGIETTSSQLSLALSPSPMVLTTSQIVFIVLLPILHAAPNPAPLPVTLRAPAADKRLVLAVLLVAAVPFCCARGKLGVGR